MICIRQYRAPGRFFLIAALMVASLATSAWAEQHGRKQILLLNSYHQNFIWNEEILRGVEEVLRPNETDIVLHLEYMDTKRVEFNDWYARQLRDVYAHKYKGIQFDAVMVSDNNAFEFLRRYHKELFPGTPVAFCGVNDFEQSQIKDHPLFTGVAETVDAKGTLDMALKLHPSTSSVYVINDYSPSGRALAHSIREQLDGAYPDLDIIYSDDLGLMDLLAEVETFDENRIILFGIYYRDREGRFHDVGESISAIATRAKAPVYGLYDFDLGSGMVGGTLISGRFQGQAMAQIVLHVLSGRHPAYIPVIREGVANLLFDYNALRKHDLQLSKLPEDSEVINRPVTFYSEHGSVIWLGVAFTAIQMVIILLLVLNITRRRKAEKDLRRVQQSLEERVRDRTSEVKESVQALRTVFDASHDAIFIHDVSGRILDVNDRMLKMYGVNRDEVYDMSIAHDMSSRDNAVYRLSSIWRSVLNGAPQFFEWKARRPHDGSEFDVEIYLSRIVFLGQEAILSNVRDISVRKESENRIRQSLSKFEAILENTLMGIAMSRGRKLITINRRGAEIFGYTPGELLGSELSLLIDSYESTEAFVVAAKDHLAEYGEFNTEQAFRSKDGDEVWCRMYAKAVDPESLDKGVIWAWDDITEYRRTQDGYLQAREEAESANRAKSEFLAAMSHEIRTPMNAIVGMTDITLQTDLTDDQREYLRTVMDSAEHLLSIINDILDLSKIEARKLTLDRMDFDLPSHVKTTIKGLQVQALQKELEITLDIADGVASCIKGDPLSLRQVLMNLVGNAIKFTHRGGITVRLRPAEAGLAGDADDPRTIGVVFQVEDTGIGIPEEFMDSIFQSFSQTTRAFGGTGLGLAICKQLIGLMGGEIQVTSTVGKGSTFMFTAWFEPGEVCHVHEPVESEEAHLATRPVHVLVAEDNEVNVMVTTLRLEEMGYTYSVASTGLEVLDLLKKETFDIILMDIEMPVLDGISATKAIRSAVRGGPISDPDIPIVGVTAHALKEFREKSIAVGMDDYVSKPVDFQALSTIIHRLVGGVPNAPEQGEVGGAESENGGSRQDDDAFPYWMPEKAMEDLGVDEAIFEGFVASARRETTARLDELRQAIGGKDLDAARESARTMKSIFTSIGAHMAALTAADLESACQADNGTKERLESLEEEVAHLLSLMNAREEAE